MFSHQSGTAGGIRASPGMGPPRVPGRVLGYPDPGNSGPRGCPPYCGGEGILVGRGPFAIWWRGEGECTFRVKCTFQKGGSGGGGGGGRGMVKWTFGQRVAWTTLVLGGSPSEKLAWTTLVLRGSASENRQGQLGSSEIAPLKKSAWKTWVLGGSASKKSVICTFRQRVVEGVVRERQCNRGWCALSEGRFWRWEAHWSYWPKKANH